MLKTTDGGFSWQIQSTGTYCTSIFDVDFLDNNFGIAVGGVGFIIKTNNGGDIWEKRKIDAKWVLSDVSIIDSNNVIVVGYGLQELYGNVSAGVLFRSTDGGDSWHHEETGTLTNYYGSFVLDSNNIFLCGLSEFISKSYKSTTALEHNENDKQVISYKLFQNYPNPFNPNTVIKFQLPQKSFVTVKIYDVLGRDVLTLIEDEKPAGNFEINFNAGHLASGVYLYRIITDKFISTKKMLLIK